jgi:hypothetical protein
MPDDEEIGASLRRLGYEPSTDGVLDLVTRRRTRLVRRRRALTVLASVAVVAILGGAVAVAASPDDDTDRVVVDSPTTLPQSTTTSTSSTSTSTSTTSSTSSTTTSTIAVPVDTNSCTAAAVIAAIGAPPSSVVAGPTCVGTFAIVQFCDPATAGACPPGETILVLDRGAWRIVGRADGCVEDLTEHMPERTALLFEAYLWCNRSWDDLLGAAVLEPGGLGPVRFGMTIADLEAATRMRIEVPEGDDSVGIGDCRWVGLGATSQAVNLIVRAPAGVAPGDLHRAAVVVSIFSYVGVTERGIRLSDPQDAVLQAYPDAEVQPNVWSQPNGLWISWPARDHPQAITFETDGSRVTGIHAGRHMPEGCHR